METIQVGPWRVTFDREATTKVHAAMLTGGAEECRCVNCKNFALQKPAPYPPDFVELLERLGIDPNKEIEVTGYEEGELLQYWGWFYFVGTVEPEKVSRPRVDGFRYHLAAGPNYTMPQFEGLPVSRVEFGLLCLPWVQGLSPSTPPDTAWPTDA